MQKVQERFLRYASYDTQSRRDTTSCPSTNSQREFCEMLMEELRDIGIEDVWIDEHGCLYATLPSTVEDESIPTLAFLAHVDTFPSVSGKNVKARVVHNYDGQEIVLNEELNIILDPKDYPSLLNYIGNDIIVTDGTTLLGADDKAGIAEIMSALEYLITHREIAHGTIKVAFTPDKEIGLGAKYFDIDKFGADFGYTVDGGGIGEIVYENFNAASAVVRVYGHHTKLGKAKNRMINAISIAMEFHGMIPSWETPEHTQGYEGFYHLEEMRAKVEKSELHYLLRDHDPQKLKKKKETLLAIRDYLNSKYEKSLVEVEITDQYYNMRQFILKDYHLIENALKAMKNLEIEPKVTLLRGGSDGSYLSYKGLTCPNLCTGVHNVHERFEYIPIESMEKVVFIILQIVQIYAQTNKNK